MSGLFDVAPAISAAYLARCAKHGTQQFTSSHEMLGVLMEEVHELIQAIHANDRAAIDREAMDVLLVPLHWLGAGGRE